MELITLITEKELGHEMPSRYDWYQPRDAIKRQVRRRLSMNLLRASTAVSATIRETGLKRKVLIDSGPPPIGDWTRSDFILYDEFGWR